MLSCVQGSRKNQFPNSKMGHIQCGMCSICFGLFSDMVILNARTSCLLLKIRVESGPAPVEKFCETS